MQNQGVSRDVLLLDIALDNYFRLCIERTDKSSMAGDDLVNLTGLVLRNAVIAYESRDLQQVCIGRLLPRSSICIFLFPLSFNVVASLSHMLDLAIYRWPTDYKTLEIATYVDWGFPLQSFWGVLSYTV